MGHQVIECDFCGSYVMEGHNDWDCNCGAICNTQTKYVWERKTLHTLIRRKPKEINMKTTYFEIVCSCCGSKNVILSEWHNSDDSGVRLRCKDCGAKEDL